MIGGPVFCSQTILKSRLACSVQRGVEAALPAEPELVAPELSLTPLLADEIEHTDDSANSNCDRKY